MDLEYCKKGSSKRLASRDPNYSIIRQDHLEGVNLESLQ